MSSSEDKNTLGHQKQMKTTKKVKYKQKNENKKLSSSIPIVVKRVAPLFTALGLHCNGGFKALGVSFGKREVCFE